MPIYEFYCPDCHIIFNYLSRSVNTQKRPLCPRCKHRKLQREVSLFAVTAKTGEGGDDFDDLPIDEAKMEKAVTALASEAENLDESDPRQAARLMRKFSDMTGMSFGEGMEEAIGRLEAGEDPDAIEQEMGDLMDTDEPFVQSGKKGGRGRRPKDRAPDRDPTLYEM